MKSKNNPVNKNRPTNFNPNAWTVLKKVATEIWNNYERGHNWNKQVLISCKEFYDMLLDENGELILKSNELVRFSKNGHITSWANELLLEGLNLMKHDEFELAINKLELHAMIKPDSALAHAKLGECKMELGLFREALLSLKKATQLNANDSEFYRLRAKAYTNLDQDKKALNDLNFSLLLSSKNAKALAARAAIWLVNGKKEEAVKDLKNAVKIESANSEFQLMLAQVHMDLKNYPKAYQALKATLNLNPFSAEALYLVAKVRIEFGIEEEKAEDELLLARALGHADAERVLINNFSINKSKFGKAA